MRTSFHHQPEAQHPNFQLSTSWQADYPIFGSLFALRSDIPPRSERRHTPDEFAAVIKANAGPRLFVPLISRLNHE